MNITKKLHIVFLDFDDVNNPLLAAGQAFASRAVGKRLAKSGHKITVFSSRFPGYKDRIEDGMEYKHIGIGTGNIRLNNLIYILTLPFYIRRLKNVDVIIEFFTAPISTMLSPVWTRIPVIAVPTSFDAERFTKMYHLPFHLVERWGSRFYKYFLPYTEELDNKMKEYNPNVISKIVPEGVDDEFFNIQRSNPKHILFLGRFDVQQKGIDLLLKAYKTASKVIETPLVIAGHGPDEHRIIEMIKELQLTDKVQLVGSAYGEKKNQLLSEAVCVAFPSRFEGFSLFSLEALAAGIPLVAFDIPSLRWAPKEIIVKAKAFNVDDYSRKLINLCQNKDLAEIMSHNAKEEVRIFTWDRVARDYLNFIYQVI